MSSTDVTQILCNLREGSDSAAARLFPLVYDELRDIADRYFRRQRNDHTLQPTALVHEAFVKLVDQTQAQWSDRAHFMAVAALAMRQLLINHAEARGAQKRGGGRARLTFFEPADAKSEETVDPIELDARKASVVELRFFGGLSVDEVATVLEVSKSTVEGDWRFARAWLSSRLSGEAPS